MNHAIQLTAVRGCWDGGKIGIDRLFPRTSYEAGTQVEKWTVSFRTGLATASQSPKSRKPTKDELKRAVKGLYWHPARGWLIDEPNVTTPLPKPPLDCVAFAVQWGD